MHLHSKKIPWSTPVVTDLRNVKYTSQQTMTGLFVNEKVLVNHGSCPREYTTYKLWNT